MEIRQLHKTSLSKLARFVNTWYVVGVFGGSALYLIIPALSLQNILLFPMIALNILLLNGRKFSRSQLLPLVFLLGYIVIVCFTTFLNPNVGEGIKVIFYQVNLLALYLIALSSPDFILGRAVKIAKIFITIWFVWAILQVLYFLGFLPGSFSFLFYRSSYVYDFYGAGVQVNGPFNNANDFGCASLLVMLFLVLQAKLSVRSPYVWFAGAIVVLAMSRTAFSLLVLFIPFLQWIKGHYARAVKSLGVLAVIITMLIATRPLWEKPVFEMILKNYGYSNIAINYSRMTSILNIWDENNHKIDNSATYRSASYKYALTQMPKHWTGTGYQNYKSFYIGAGFRNMLIWVNPHSYLIEVGIAYGLPALICILCFLCIPTIYLWRQRMQHSAKLYITLILFYSLVLSNVPSSIMLMTLFWLPLIFGYGISSLRVNRRDFNPA